MKPVKPLIVAGIALFVYAGCEPASEPQTPPKESDRPSGTEAAAAADGPPDVPKGPGDAVAVTADPTRIVDGEGRVIPVSTGAAPGYVPDASCAECHALIYDTYSHVGMARSAYEPTVDNIIEDYDDNSFYHEPSERYYELYHQDGTFYQKRYQLDADGKRINEYEATVDFIIGSGNHVRTYLTRNPAGELFQLPVSWYEQTQSWAMSPGYDVPNNPGFTRQVKRDCMFCHNAYPEQPEGTDVLGQPFVYPETLPEGIGCQRCHGPGAEHTRVALNPKANLKALRGSIVNPSRLEPQLRDDVCMQCHLQPSANPSSFMRLAGRSDYSYRPGEAIQDYMLIVDYGSPEQKAERFEINHHPYRLFQSPCYIESEGAMSCLTCHDPHGKPPPRERVAYYRAKCLTCHQIEQCDVAAMADPDHTNHETAADCVSCHMPKRRTHDVIQVLATDHLIRKEPAPDEWTEPREELGKQRPTRPHPFSADRAPQDDETLTLHLAMFAARHGNVRRLDAVKKVIDEQQPESPEPYLFLAQLYETADRFSEAAATYRMMTERFPDLLGGYTGLAYALSEQSRFDDALVAARQAVAVHPTSPDAYQQLGTALWGLDRVAEAGPSFERAVQLRPFHIAARSNLARAFASVGDLRAALAEYERILAIDPLESETYADLADVLIFLRQHERAIKRLRHGVRLLPGSPTLHASLAMALVADDQFNEALDIAAKARELGVHETVASLVEVIAYHETGRNRQAIEASQRMQSAGKKPQHRSVLYSRLRERAIALLTEGRAKP